MLNDLINKMQEEIKVGYCKLITISTDSQLQSLEWRTRLGAHWQFLSDENRQLQKDLKIQESLRNTWKGFYIANGDYDYLSAQVAVKSGYADAVTFGRPYIANPDLVERFEAGAELNEQDQDTFYGGDEKGDIDYPFMNENDM